QGAVRSVPTRRASDLSEPGRSTGEAGAIRQVPCFCVPRRPEKTAGESKRGRHSQSIEPSSQTWALVCMSPIRPYCSIRGRRFIRSEEHTSELQSRENL